MKFIFSIPNKVIACLLFICLTAVSLRAQEEAKLLGHWQDTTIVPAFYGPYNDVWGIVVDGREYGVIGSTAGVHFLDLDDPDGVKEVAFVAGASVGSNIIHRDYHSYQHYLYAVADEGANSSLQVIDFSGLPNEVKVVYDKNDVVKRTHNIFIDEANARLYTSEGVMVFSLEDPENPTLLDHLFFNGLGIPGAHDIFVRDNILYLNGGRDGFYVIDYNDVDDPKILGAMLTYPEAGYNHSGWLSEDGSHYFLCDETANSDVKSVDVRDFSDIHVVDLYNSGRDDHIPHNAMVKGNQLFVSYYSDGLQVFDISDPSDVKRTYFYDTDPDVANSYFRGAWGIYALLPSGRILISDLLTGFYMIEVPKGEVVGLETVENSEIKVYPNPATDFIQIEFGQTEATNMQIELLDINGRRLRTWNKQLIQDRLLLPIAELNSGYYLLRMSTKDWTISRKIIFE